MKTKNVLLSGILGIALAGVVLTGCHKDSTAPAASTDTDITAAEDESNASSAMNDSKNVSDAAAQNNAGKYAPTKNIGVIYGHCTVTWSRDTAIGSDTLYVNFGPTPVLCLDGRWRQGEIIVYGVVGKDSTLRRAYWDSGSVLTMTFSNYAVGNTQNNMVGIAGTRTWTNNGINALYQENWSFNANITLTYFSTGQTATWKSIRTNTLVLQGGAYYYEITGSAYGVSRKGIVYTLSITNPLYVTALPWWLGGCVWIESGVITVNRTGNPNTLAINFGNVGTCDDIAVATITTPTGSSTSYTIYMW